MTGPSTVDRPITGPNAANALPMCCGGNRSRISPKVCGTITAAASPWAARAATSTSPDHANEQNAEDTTNPTRPIISIRLRPNMSPRRAPAIRPTASARVYAAATHSSADVLIARSAWIGGRRDVDDRRVEDVQDHRGEDDREAGPHQAGAPVLRPRRLRGAVVRGRGGWSMLLGRFVRRVVMPLTLGVHQARFVPDQELFSTHMAETSGRLLKLLSLLQTPREWPGPELAHRLGVTQRTVRNDVDRLRQLGYPVLASRGSVGGYRLSAGTAMPPLLLDDDEAVAVAVALSTASGGAVDGMEETALQALTKLLQVLPKRLQRPGRRAPGPHGPGGRPSARHRRRRQAARPGRSRGARPRGGPVRLLRPLRRRDRAPGRALPARQLGPALVPRRLGPPARRLAHLPLRPDERDPLGRAPVPGARAPRRGRRGVRRQQDPPGADEGDRPGRRTRSARRSSRSGSGSWTQGSIEPLGDDRCRVQIGARSPEDIAFWLGVLDRDFEVEDSPDLADAVRRVSERYARATAAG